MKSATRLRPVAGASTEYTGRWHGGKPTGAVLTSNTGSAVIQINDDGTWAASITDGVYVEALSGPSVVTTFKG